MREDFPGFHTGPIQTECGVITLTPDDKFVIDRRGDIVIGAGCMGHAFKFAPAIGEALADLAENRALSPDFARFKSDRPSLTGTSAEATASPSRSEPGEDRCAGGVTCHVPRGGVHARSRSTKPAQPVTSLQHRRHASRARALPCANFLGSDPNSARNGV